MVADGPVCFREVDGMKDGKSTTFLPSSGHLSVTHGIEELGCRDGVGCPYPHRTLNSQLLSTTTRISYHLNDINYLTQHLVSV
jgi:hypothetical protein